MKLSFIIPFYNGEKYIDECLRSLRMQDVRKDEYEIIIVDDCSTEPLSLKVLDKCIYEYENVKVIHNSHNCRCGECRNIGVQNASGQYIWFVDQDDYIETNCLEQLLTLCLEKDLDMLVFNYCIVNDNKSLNISKKMITDRTETTSGLEFIQNRCEGDFWSREYDTNIWHSIFKRQFLINHNIFAPKVSYCEDMIVALHAIIVADRIETITDELYYYRYNDASVFHTEVGKKGRSIFDASLYAGEQIINLSSLIDSAYPDLRANAFNGGVSRINSFYKTLLKIPNKERKIFYRLAKQQKSILKEVFPHLSIWGKWEIMHPILIQLFPHTTYAIIKLSEIL